MSAGVFRGFVTFVTSGGSFGIRENAAARECFHRIIRFQHERGDRASREHPSDDRERDESVDVRNLGEEHLQSDEPKMNTRLTFR